MVNRFLFKDRDGRTPLTPDFKKELTPEYAHINLGGELDSAEEENITDGLVWLDDQNGDPKDWMFWERLHKKLFENVWLGPVNLESTSWQMKTLITLAI